MPRGSRLGRASRDVSQQGTPSRVLYTLYGPKLCTLKSLLLTLLASPSEAELPVGNSNSHNAQGQDHATPPAAGSNQSLYSDLLNDFRNSAAFPTPVECGSLVDERVDKIFSVSMAAEVAGSLVRDTDSVDYLNLLNSSYVALNEGAPRPGILEFMQRWTQKEVVHRIIELQFQQTGRPSNVLCAGYRKLHPGTSSSTKLDAPRGLECAFRNTSVEILKSQPWVTLLSRVGDALMLYLLSNSSIFISLHGSSFLQIAGPAINTVATAASRLRPYFESVEREPATGRSQSLAPSRPIPTGTCRSVPCFEQKLKASQDIIGHTPWKNSDQQSKKEVQLHSNGDKSMERKRGLKRKWVMQDRSDVLQGAENGGNGTGPGRNSLLCSVRSKRSRMTYPLQSVPMKRKVTSPGRDCGLVNDTGKQSSGHVKRSRQSSQYFNGSTVSANSRSILILEAEQADDVECESCTQRGESLVTGRKRARPSSWQRRKAQMLQQTNTEHLSRGGSPQTENKPPAADVQLDQLLLSEDLPPLSPWNTDSQNSKQGDQIRHLVEGAQLAKNCHSSCSGPLDCGPKFLDDIAHEPATDVQTNLQCVGSSCKTAADLPTKSVELRTQVIRSSIFYCSAFSQYAGLPRKHILNTARPNSKGALQLFGVIFRNKDHTSSPMSRSDLEIIQHNEPLNYKLVRRLFKGLLRNSRKCCYARLLNRHCPLPWRPAESMGMDNSEVAEVLITHEKEVCTRKRIGSEHGGPAEVCVESSPNTNARTAVAEMKTQSVSTAEGNSGTTVPISTEIENFDTGEEEVTSCHPGSSLEELISSFITHRQVVAFLWAVTRSIIPASLLGCKRSWRALRSSLARFVSLRRYEKFSLKQYLFRLKTDSFDWLHSVGKDANESIPANGDAKHMLESWSHWYFTSFVVPLIRAHFYVTESENSRRDVFYYRKPVWARIKAMALKDLVETSFERVSPSRLTSTLQERVLGFSKIRFVPKKNSVRPIVNLGAPSKCSVTVSVPAKPLSFKQVFGMPGYFGKKINFEGLSGTQQVSKLKKRLLHFKSVNSVLRDVHSCLKADLEEHAEDLGCSVFGYNDTYLRLVPFVMKLKSCQDGVPQLYFGVCDVAKAFDTIKQQKLCEIIGKFLHKEQYSVFRYVSVIPTAGTVRVCFRRACTASAEHQNFLDIAFALTHRSPHAVYADQVFFTTLSRKRILAMLHDHVKRSMLQIGSKFYIQTVGIAQGSVLSSLFCSLFYGHLDKHYLLPCLKTFTEPRSALQHEHACINGLATQGPQNQVGDFSTNLGLGAGQREDDDCLCGKASNSKGMTDKQNAGHVNVFGAVADSIRFVLLRLTDDSLFISTSKAQVSLFVEKMHNGFAEYGCRANQRKTALSFDMYLKEHFIRQSVYQTDDGARFMRWSGLLINCHTLEIQADYSRYSGKDIRSTLTVVVESNQGYHLSMKLCQFMRPKCHPLLYDLNINSPATVRLNAYQAFLLCAMKFHAYARAMPPVGAHNPSFLFKAICTAVRYMHRLIQQRMQAMKHVSSFTPCFSFPMKEMKWLGLLAFRKVLWRKQCGHKELILLLEAELRMRKYSDLSRSLFLNYAVDDRRSSMFHSIKY